MKKFGFTLTEVLITLSIIGVIAALTTPALFNNSRNEANAAKLAVTVSNLENAFATAIATEGVPDLFHTEMWNCVGDGNQLSGTFVDDKGISQSRVACFVGQLGRYLVTNGLVKTSKTNTNPIVIVYGAGNGIHPMTEDGETNNGITIKSFAGELGQGIPIYMKNGAVIFISAYGLGSGNDDMKAARTISEQRENQLRALGTSYIYNAADVVIDVNGKEGPNTNGRDVFYFQVSEKGILYPSGSIDVAISDPGIDDDATWDSPTPNGSSCTDASKGNDANIRGQGCTARLMQENYKMNY